MSVGLEFGLHLFANSRRLAEEAKAGKRPYLVAKNSKAGVECEAIAEQTLPDRIAISLGILQTFQGFAEPPHQGLCFAEEAVADKPVRRVLLPGGHFHDLASQGERRPHSPRDVVGCPKTIEN